MSYGTVPAPQDPIPPQLTPEDVQEFKRLIKETTGHDLTDEEAWDRATELIALYRMFLGPIPEDPEANHPPRP